MLFRVLAVVVVLSVLLVASSSFINHRILPHSSRNYYQQQQQKDRKQLWGSTSSLLLMSSSSRSQFQSEPPLLQPDMNQPYVITEGTILRDDILNEEKEYTSKQFLTNFPSGAYSTMRTVNSKSILRLQQHLARMTESIRLMLNANKEDTKNPVESKNPSSIHNNNNNHHYKFVTEGLTISINSIMDESAVQSIHSLLKESLVGCVSAFDNLFPLLETCEKRITTLLTWEYSTDDYCVLIRVLNYAELLPAIPSGRIVVQLSSNTSRSNALAKDSQWVLDRKQLEQQTVNTKPPVHEVLLSSSSDNSVLEGLSSNLFAISKSGTVYTAKNGILLGTLRTIVLRVCAELDIPVVETPPICTTSTTATTDNGEYPWVGMFISSTSRLALPVTDLILKDDGDTVDIVHFSYQDMEEQEQDNNDGCSLGLMQDQIKRHISVKDTKGIMKNILDGVNAAVVNESESLW